MFVHQAILSASGKKSLAYSMAEHIASIDMLSLNAAIRKSVTERNLY